MIAQNTTGATYSIGLWLLKKPNHIRRNKEWSGEREMSICITFRKIFNTT